MRRLLPLVLLLLTTVACNDEGSTGPDRPGSLSFRYSGDQSGNYRAAGNPAEDAQGSVQFTREFAIAAREEGTLTLVGLRPGATGRVDMLQLPLGSPTRPGEIAICDFAEDDCDQLGAFLLGLNPASDSPDATAVYVFQTGSIRVTEISAQRVRGTFRAEGFFVNLNNLSFETRRRLAVTEGEFDVPIRDGL